MSLAESKKQQNKDIKKEQNAKEKKDLEKKTKKKPKRQSRVKLKKQHYIGGGVLIAIVLAVIIVFLSTSGFHGSIYSNMHQLQNNAKVAKVDLYVMSFCPYGTQTENTFDTVAKKFGDKVKLNVEYIARKNPDGSFTSLHGPSEVQLDKIQLCAKKYYPSSYFDFIVCQNNNSGRENVKLCAQQNKMDEKKILDCANSIEGNNLLSDSIAKSDSVHATASPTIYINGEQYVGGRSPLDFSRSICSVFNYSINECKNISRPVEVKFIVLNDKNCKSCDTSKIIFVSKQLFPGVKVTKIDVSSNEGKKIVSENNITLVPAYLFDSNLEKTQTWKMRPDIRTVFEKVGQYYKLKDEVTGASYYINAEARKQHLKSLGITLGDNRPQIDFYVMSFCPYGNQAEEAIASVYNVLKGKADFNPHYVIYSNYAGGSSKYCIENGTYCSMHGVQEVHQDIRELCVNKYMGTDDYFKFIVAINKKCNSRNVDSCWENIAKDLNLSVSKIKECEKNESASLAKQEYNLNKIWHVSGSPTVFIDGQLYTGKRTPQAYLNALCGAFEKAPKECSTKISSSGATPTGSC